MTSRKIEKPDHFRNNIKTQLKAFLPNGNDASNLEKGIHNWSLKESTNRQIIKKWDNPHFVRIYLDHLRSVYINISQSKCIIEQVNEGLIKSHEIAFMTHQEMQPEKWQALIDAKKIRDDNLYAPKIDGNTDNFTCRKCKSKNCSYYQLQTRSGDEPMTTFVTCINCGNRWKC